MLKIVAGALALLVVGGGLAAGYRAARQHAAAERLAIRTPHGVQEERFVRIGGIEQWVSIRGEDRANAVLVIAHGGPGNSFLPFTYEALRPWEAHFTVVQWDQRGAGRTYVRGGPDGQGEVSLDRISRDGLEVVEHALSRTGQERAILLGASWGSIVGVDMVRRRPGLFHAYVGNGQVIDMQRNEAVGYEQLMQRIRAAGDVRAEAKLARIGPPPYAGLKEILAERAILRRFPPASERGATRQLTRALLFAPGLSLKDAWDIFQPAALYSMRRLGRALLAYSDPKPYAPFEVPVVLIQGEEDIQTPTSLVREYYAEITAPRKELVLLPGGGHLAVLAMPDPFLEALLKHVAPLAAPAPPTRAPGPERAAPGCRTT